MQREAGDDDDPSGGHGLRCAVLQRARQDGKIRFMGITEAFERDTRHEMLVRAVEDKFSAPLRDNLAHLAHGQREQPDMTFYRIIAAAAVLTAKFPGLKIAGTLCPPVGFENDPAKMAEALNATHTLRDGKTLRMPNIPDHSLQGVLRSELDSVVNAHLARTLRSVRVDAEPTLQALLSGPVAKPGYHPVEPDMLVTDVMMQVGGPAGNADLRRSVVKRDGKEIVSRDSLQAAIRNGATLDRIDFRSGDELVVGEVLEPVQVSAAEKREGAEPVGR